jgi:hypothetical protein
MKGGIRSGSVTDFEAVSFGMRAPLRALSYTVAGGALSEGGTLASIMKFGRGTESTNAFDNKIVMLDEAHNLLSKTEKHIDRLVVLLESASDLTLAAFTATPLVSHPNDGQILLDIVGSHSAGVLVSAPVDIPDLLPAVTPSGVQDGSLLCSKVWLDKWMRRVPLHGPALDAYRAKKQDGLPPDRLQRYCNVPRGCFSQASLDALLEDPKIHFPKLWAVVQDIVQHTEKL